jgi:hypothetical protein
MQVASESDLSDNALIIFFIFAAFMKQMAHPIPSQAMARFRTAA